MNTFFYSILTALLMTTVACQNTSPEPESAPGSGDDKPRAGIVQGRVVDSQGKPVANATIVANSTDYYNKTTTAYTDAGGHYQMQLPTGIAAGSYSVDGSVTVRYQGRNYMLALYNENPAVFSAYDGAIRNFIFRLTGKRNEGDSENDSSLGGKLEAWNSPDHTERANIEVTLEPDGPLVDGSTGKKIVARLPEYSNYLEDIPVGKYKIRARDVVTGQVLGISIMDSLEPYKSSVSGLFVDDDFVGSTHFRLAINIDTL